MADVRAGVGKRVNQGLAFRAPQIGCKTCPGDKECEGGRVRRGMTVHWTIWTEAPASDPAAAWGSPGSGVAQEDQVVQTGLRKWGQNLATLPCSLSGLFLRTLY